MSTARNTLYGGICGLVGTVFGTPGEVLKVRMVNDLAMTKYKSKAFVYLFFIS